MQLLIGTIVVVVLGSFISALTVFSIKGNSSSFVFSLLISLMAGFLAIAIATSVISIQSRNFVEDFTFEYESANTVEQQKMIENLQGESFDINSVTPLKNGNFVFDEIIHILLRNFVELFIFPCISITKIYFL